NCSRNYTTRMKAYLAVLGFLLALIAINDEVAAQTLTEQEKGVVASLASRILEVVAAAAGGGAQDGDVVEAVKRNSGTINSMLGLPHTYNIERMMSRAGRR
ncbi:unnamed protein product, partial [Meganyctiphanes norvegica]